MRVSDIRFHPATEDLRSKGLRGWATVTVDGEWTLASIAVRRAADGRYVLAFPTRRDSSGTEHPYYRPASREARRQIETEVLTALRARGFVT